MGLVDDQRVIVILTALELEFAAVRRLFDGWQVRRHEAGTVFEVTRLRQPGWSLAIARTGQGNINAAVLTERAIAMFRPRALFFVGVAGALKADLDFGHVVVATKVYGYHGGKDEKDGFGARPEAWRAPHHLEQMARHVATTAAWLQRHPAAPAVHFQPIAAGEVVLNSRQTALADQLRRSYNDAAAIEMESAGLFGAGHLNRSQPMLTIRGISDKADGRKHSADKAGWQAMAAAHAAQFARAMAEAVIAFADADASAVAGQTSADASEAASAKPAGGWPRPFMAPPLPSPGIVGRDDVLTEVVRLLRLDDPGAVEVPPIALRGMGGVGKTTIAAAVGRLDVVMRHFSDGVLWTALGPEPTVRHLLEGWGRALGADLLAEPDEQACTERLRAALYERRLLIIVDDVWDARHGGYFLIGGPGSRTLLTTREAEPAFVLATRERTRSVNLLDPAAALQLLARLAPDAVALDPRTAMTLCERLEFLPLGLTLAGRMLAAEADVPGRLQRVLDELVERRAARLDLPQVERRIGLPECEPVSLRAILGLSVDRLSQADRARFAQLAVFGVTR